MNTSTKTAFKEAIDGQHVAHICGHRRCADRTAAIRPNGDGTFNLDFSSHLLDLREEMRDVSEHKARKLVAMFISGIAVDVKQDRVGGYAYVDLYINQADRECEIELDTLTPTRVRINYDLPNTGGTGAWRNQARIGDYMFLGRLFESQRNGWECGVDTPSGY